MPERNGADLAPGWGRSSMNMTIDELLEMPYWVADILPRQVPRDSPGQYFAIERHYLREPQITAIKQRHIDLVLKLNCYYDLSLDDERGKPSSCADSTGDARSIRVPAAGRCPDRLGA